MKRIGAKNGISRGSGGGMYSIPVKPPNHLILPNTKTTNMPMIVVSIKKLNPGFLTKRKPIAHAIIAVIRVAAGKATQKDSSAFKTSAAEAYAPIPQKAAIPRLINPVLSIMIKVMANIAFMPVKMIKCI